MSGRALAAIVLGAVALASASSAAADPINTAPPELTGATVVAGKPFAGSSTVLTASAGSWSSTAPLLYDFQWQRCSYVNSVVDSAPIAYFRLGESAGPVATDS